MSQANGIDQREARIDANEWTLFDRLVYGGLGYGAFCLPTNFFKILFTVLYPPLGEILNIVSDFIVEDFPYISWETLKAVMNNLDRIIYSFILTSMFYVPGLIFTLGHITCQHDEENNEVITLNRYNSEENNTGSEDFKDIIENENKNEDTLEQETSEDFDEVGVYDD